MCVLTVGCQRMCKRVCLKGLRHVFRGILLTEGISIEKPGIRTCNVNTYREVIFYRSRRDFLAMDFRTSLLLSLLSGGPVSLSNVGSVDNSL